MSIVRSSLIITFIAALTGCNTEKPDDASSHSTSLMEREISFFYRIDETSPAVVVAEGVIVLPSTFSEQAEFQGSWRLRSTGAQNVTDPLRASFIAPLFGSGTLHGIWNEQQCSFDLHPGTIDNNVEIIIAREAFHEGRWQYVTDAGVSASGRVELGAAYPAERSE